VNDISNEYNTNNIKKMNWSELMELCNEPSNFFEMNGNYIYINLNLNLI
jgi:hypothetical protein